MRTNRTMDSAVRMTALAALAAAALACTHPARTAPERGAPRASNAEIARRFVEGFLGGKDPAVIDEVAREDIKVYTGLKPDGPIVGREQYKQVFRAFTNAFPEAK